MPVFRLPLSGNVSQSILPWTFTFNPVGGQVGLVNIELGQSSAPAVEEEVMTDVASYGKQLGQISDALLVLLDTYTPSRALTSDEDKAIAALRDLAGKVKRVKARHGRG